jgi:hypothetical protein
VGRIEKINQVNYKVLIHAIRQLALANPNRMLTDNDIEKEIDKIIGLMNQGKTNEEIIEMI